MENIQEMLNNCVVEMENSGKIKEILEKQITSMLKSVFEDMFRSYGDIAKKLKEDLKQRLKINLEELSFPDYNKNLLAIVKECLDSNISDIGMEKFKKDIDNLMKTEAPKEIKITDLIEKFKETCIDDDCEERVCGEISYHCGELSYSSRRVYFDFEPDKEKYSCKYQLWFREDGEVCEISISGSKFKNKLVLGGLWGFDAFLFKMYSLGTKIIDDSEDVDCGYGDY